MIEIKKLRAPSVLECYRRQAGATYSDMDSQLKKTVLESLMNEQGHLCAYCMRRIPEKRQLPVGVHPVTIEHWDPQRPQEGEDHGQGLEYNNMFAVCAGNRGCGNKNDLTCDASRGNVPLTVNPSRPRTLVGIKYSSDGEISSSDECVHRDLTVILNLNCEAISLPQNRKRALDALIKDISKNHPTGDIKSYCRKRLEELTQQRENKVPYIGILIWWLERHT